MVLEYLVMIRYFSFYTWVLGNEFGSGPRPHPHTHAVIVTTEKMNFEEFKKQWKKESTDVKYVSREDFGPIVYYIDWDLTSVACRAYVTAEKYDWLLT